MDQKITLSNGVKIPQVGLGVWKAEDGQQVEQAVLWALEAGYRHIDTAAIYGNEDGVGSGIKKSGVPREEIFVTTKLWNEDQGYETALKAVDVSLKKLGLDYVDLYLVHWPITVRPLGDFYKNIPPTKREETWKAMEAIYNTGKAKAIGVCNFTVRHLEEMPSYASVMPMVNQVELNPFLYQKELIEFCQSKNIAVEAYCPLVHGNKLDDPRISEISERYNKTNAQVLIRWSLQHGLIPLPKSVHQNRIQENLNVFDFELSDEDMSTLDALNENFHNTFDPNLLP